MASLQKHRVNGITYWRIVESRRINGKPRAIPVLHLGTADAMLAKFTSAPQSQCTVRSFQHGDIAALIAIAQRLKIAELIDRHLPEAASSSRPSVGQTMVLAACNRAIRPRSKRGWAEWAESTSIAHLDATLNPRKLTSQFFWDQMNRIPEEKLADIERDLTKTIVADLGVTLDTLFYDTTNFFTYIDSTNTHCDLPQRGHSKQKRSDLRIFGLALIVSRDGQIPICSHVYQGNRADAKEFIPAMTTIRQRLADLSITLQDVTVVYDRGNLSRQNQQEIDDSSVGYVSALVPSQQLDLMAVPLSEYRTISTGRLQNLKVHRTSKIIWGKKRVVVMYRSEAFSDGQKRGLDQAMARAQKTLFAWQERLKKQRSGSRSQVAVDRRIERIRSAQFLKKILHITYDSTKKGTARLTWDVDQAAYKSICNDYFGKRILTSNRESWSDEDIILAYRGQSGVEDAFKQSKDDEHFAMRPQFHWTDQKIQVHAFICLLALLLGRVIEREARKQHRTQTLSHIMDELGTIRLAMVVNGINQQTGGLRCQWMLEESKPETLALFTSIVPNSPPFVYTAADM